MELFKERLKQVGNTIFLYVGFIAAMLLLMWIVTFIPQMVANWIGGIFVGLFAALLLGGFIYWLFIEPFKKK